MIGNHRPPTPRDSSSTQNGRRFVSKGKVAFKVSKMDRTPPASDREGDEEDDDLAMAEVDAYLAARSLGFDYDLSKPWAEYTDDSEHE